MRTPRIVVPPRFLTKQHHKAQEERVYQAARTWVDIHGKPPSVRNLAGMLDLNYVTVHRHLDDLVRSGRITKQVHGRLTVDMGFPMEQP